MDTHNTNPLDADTDDDGLNDGAEIQQGSNPQMVDTDGDGLSDNLEAILGTNPGLSDSDQDGLPDPYEVGHGLNPTFAGDAAEDPDGDGLTNLQEYAAATDPQDADSDDDELGDGSEINSTGTDPLNADSDGDQLPDGWENACGLDPLSGIRSNLLLAAWWKFDEGSGSAVHNALSTNYEGIAHYIVSSNWCDGRIGKALYLDGLNDYVAIPQNPPVVAQGPFTVSAWVRHEHPAPSPLPTVLSDGEPGGSGRWPGYLLRYESPTDQMAFQCGTHSDFAPGCHSARWGLQAAGRWVHLAVTWDGRIGRLYVDGAIAEEVETPFAAVGQPELWIGRGHVNAHDSYWRGAVDDLRIYRTALDGEDISRLHDVLGDLDSDGEDNLTEFLNGSDPATNRLPGACNDGSIDLQFAPLDWRTNGPLQYLARFDDANSGNEMHVCVAQDTVAFSVYDALGQCHSIRQSGLLGERLILSNQTNRITASWRHFNSGRTNAEMSLMVNGLDIGRAFGLAANPKRTGHRWRQGEGYYDAAMTRADFTACVTSNRLRVGAYADGVHTAHVAYLSAVIHTDAYGIVSDRPAPPFATAEKTARPPFPHPQTLVQGISLPVPFHVPLSDAEARALTHSYAECFDAAELEQWWLGWGLGTSNLWPLIETSLQTLIRCANDYGLDIALSDWNGLSLKVTLESGLGLSAPARCLVADPVSGIVRATNVVRSEVTACDGADRAVVSNFVARWKEDLSAFTNCTYFLFNEDSMQSYTNVYLSSPTFTAAGLDWFRAYVGAKYADPRYDGIRFPVYPVYVPTACETNRSDAGRPLTLDPSVTNLAAITTDPDVWAKWWEWRNVVFAHSFALVAESLQQLNAGNPRWRGTVYLVSPASVWQPVCAIDLDLVARIPGLDYVVMENTRLGTYGMQPQDLEEEVRLQLGALKGATTNHTGFGSYVLAHTFMHPDEDDNFTWNTTWMTQDLAMAYSPALASEILVPFSAPLIVDRPWTQQLQNARFTPEVAALWHATRFHDGWEAVTNLTPCGGAVFENSDVELAWSSPPKATGFDLEFSTSASFAHTNAAGSADTNRFTYERGLGLLPDDENIFWRVRGRYPVLTISTNNVPLSTNVYAGAWSACTNGGFVLTGAP